MKHFLLYLSLVGLLCAALACNKTARKATAADHDCMEQPAKQPCPCTREYRPVCGCDGKSYNNPCEARCAGVKTFVNGKCASTGQNNEQSDCLLAADVADCLCTKEYKPVCGCDGKTYGNACMARCKVKSFVERPCPKTSGAAEGGNVISPNSDDCVTKQNAGDCVCAQMYAPVRGCDGKVYSNPCTAACHVSSWQSIER